MNREKPRLCLVFAMGMEMGPFLDRVQPVRRWSHGKAAYREVFFEGVRLLVVRSGIGPQRAASALGHLGPRPDLVLSVGTAGALNEGLRVGDLVIASETVASYESDGPLVSDSALVDLPTRACIKEGRSFLALQQEADIHRSACGEITGLEEEIHGRVRLAGSMEQIACRTRRRARPCPTGNALAEYVTEPEQRNTGDSRGPRLSSPDLGGHAVKEPSRSHIPGVPGRNFCIDRMVTVRDAVFSPEDRTGLRDATRAAAVDMETYALACVARDLGIPFGCLRVISDDFCSPRMPLRRSPRISWNRPLAIPADLLAKLRWSRFLKEFERSVATLPPVLVRLIRELKREG